MRHAAEDEEHEVRVVPAGPMEEDNEQDADVNRRAANETLRTALTGFRNAAAGLRNAAAVVVSGRRRRAERVLRDLERADRARARARGVGRGGRGGRGRGGREDGLVHPGVEDLGSDGEEQDDALDARVPQQLQHVDIARGRGRGGRMGALGMPGGAGRGRGGVLREQARGDW